MTDEQRLTELLKEKMLECRTYEELARALIDNDVTFRTVKVPRDCYDNGYERWVCPCGNLLFEKVEHCDECGARLIYKEGM